MQSRRRGPADDSLAATTWYFEYAIRSCIDDGRKIVGKGRASVRVTPGTEPAEAAVSWVHESDYRADPRIQPMVDIHSIKEGNR